MKRPLKFRDIPNICLRGQSPRTPRPVSDDDTVDNFSCRLFGVFPIFPNFEKIEKKRTFPNVRFSGQQIISKLYLYKLYYYTNLFFISQFFLPNIRRGFQKYNSFLRTLSIF